MADTIFRTVLPALKAIDNGDGTYSVAIVIGGRAIPLPVLTTAQRNALTPAQGWIIYNSTTNQAEAYNGAAWVAVGSLYADGAIAVHAALATGIHGVGGSTVASVANIATHTADLDAHTFNPFSKLITGIYLSTGSPSSFGTQALTANKLYAMPFEVARALTLDRLAIAVTIAGAGGTKARLGIYNDGTNLYPRTLKLDAGLVAVDGVATVAATIAQALAKGRYWLALVTDGTPTVRSATFQYSGQSPLGFDANFRFYDGWIVTFTYAALPDPYTAGGVGSNAIPLIGARISSLD